MRGHSILGVCLYVLVVSGQPAWSQPVYFDFYGECQSNTLGCSALGLNEGDPVEGYIAFDAVALDTNSWIVPLSPTEVVDFGLTAGTLEFNSAHLDSAFPRIDVKNANYGMYIDSTITTAPAFVPGLADDFTFLSDDAPGPRIVSPSLGEIRFANPVFRQRNPPSPSFEDLGFYFHTETHDDDGYYEAVSLWDVVNNSRFFDTKAVPAWGEGFTQPVPEWAESHDYYRVGPDRNLYVIGNNLGSPDIRVFDAISGKYQQIGGNYLGYLLNGGGLLGVDSFSLDKDGSLLLTAMYAEPPGNPYESAMPVVQRISGEDGTILEQFATGTPIGPEDLFSGGMGQYLTPIGDGTAYYTYIEYDASTGVHTQAIELIDLVASFSSGTKVVLDAIDGVSGVLYLGPNGELFLSDSHWTQGAISRLDFPTGVLTPFIEDQVTDLTFVNGRAFALSGQTLVEYNPVTGERLWTVIRPEGRIRNFQGFTAFSLIPEPSAIVLLLTAGVTAAGFGRKR